MKLILLLAFSFATFNTGLIWFVQIVHYPGFLRIGQNGYDAYQSFHMKSITTVVGPSMLMELILSGAVLLYFRELPHATLYLVALGLLGLIWLNTAIWAAPTHGKLLSGHNAELIQKLININWWRTIFWTARAFILGYILYKI